MIYSKSLKLPKALYYLAPSKLFLYLAAHF